MFELPIWQFSTTSRAGGGQWFAGSGRHIRIVAYDFRFALRGRPPAIPYAAGLYITSAYWFHGLNVLRQSGSDDCALAFGYSCRHSALGRYFIHRGPAGGDGNGGDHR